MWRIHRLNAKELIGDFIMSFPLFFIACIKQVSDQLLFLRPSSRREEPSSKSNNTKLRPELP